MSSCASDHYVPFEPHAPHALLTADPGTAARCRHSNFLKGVKWSPDGACCLTASDDNVLRVFDLPPDAQQRAQAANAGEGPASNGLPSSSGSTGDSLTSALRVEEGETIYDYAWFSRMSVSDPVSCCFASTSRAHPIHLWDACSGSLRCSYRGYNAVDEVAAAYSLAFSPDGSKIYAGYDRAILVFDVSRPGRDYVQLTTSTRAAAKAAKAAAASAGGGSDGGGDAYAATATLPGIVSCIAFPTLLASTTTQLFAAGAYSGVIGLFDSLTNQMACALHGHAGGLTHLQFSPDGNYLLSGARQDGDILCWDVRQMSGEVYRLPRDTRRTNQRIYFDVEPCGRHLATGGSDGRIRVFDLATGHLVGEAAAAGDTVNGCAFHPSLPLLATASGHRRHPLFSGVAAGRAVAAASSSSDDISSDDASSDEGDGDDNDISPPSPSAPEGIPVGDARADAEADEKALQPAAKRARRQLSAAAGTRDAVSAGQPPQQPAGRSPHDGSSSRRVPSTAAMAVNALQVWSLKYEWLPYPTDTVIIAGLACGYSEPL